jgi:response regulator RpfG family c-di-GMP phosphodiesterase
MGESILLVDDDPVVLDLYQRHLGEEYLVVAAGCGEEALQLIDSGKQPALILSDQRMPDMLGTELLAIAAEKAPRSVRLLITAYADLDAAIDAINEGHVFMFLTKPCPAARLRLAIARGMKQYRLQNAERELLEQTLNGSVKLLTDILAVANPLAFGHASRVSRLVGDLARRVGLTAAWYFELAAMLSQTGCIAVPEEVLDRAFHLMDLAPEEEAQFVTHPQVGSSLVGNIPRLEEVSRIVSFQNARYDGEGGPHPGVSGEAIPFAARLLHIASDYDLLTSNGMIPLNAMAEMRRRQGEYDPRGLEALAAYITDVMGYTMKQLPLGDIEVGMVMADEVINPAGAMLVGRGQEVTPALHARLQTLQRAFPSRMKFRVVVPAKHPSLAGEPAAEQA